MQESKPGRGVSAAAAALAAAKAAASATAHGQASVTETRRFAGKDVQVRLVPACIGWLGSMVDTLVFLVASTPNKAKELQQVGLSWG